MAPFIISAILLALIPILIALCIFSAIKSIKAKKEQQKKEAAEIERIRSFAKSSIEISPKEFMDLRKNGFRSERSGIDKNAPGVYILYNKTKNLYYVGQGQRVFERVNMHFTGRGNGDVYADHKYGDLFTIRVIFLAGSGCKTLNELERKTITAYDSVAHGYNKTHGNSDRI